MDPSLLAGYCLMVQRSLFDCVQLLCGTCPEICFLQEAVVLLRNDRCSDVTISIKLAQFGFIAF